MNFLKSLKFTLFFNLVSNHFILRFLYILIFILINLLSFFYLCLKFYKVICYSRLTFEWLPMLNPYDWPFSFFQLVTTPYFNFWLRIMPVIQLQTSSLEVSGIIALEALNALAYLCVRLFNLLSLFLKELNTLLP